MKVVARTSSKDVPMWFDNEKILPVLAFFLMPSSGPKFLLWSKKQLTVALFPIADFEVVDPTLPAQWIAKTAPNGHIEFSPKDWQADGFWGGYHEGDPEAAQIFHRCYEALVSEKMAVQL